MQCPPLCPVCNQPMIEFREGTSHSKKTGQQYTRTLYACRKHDVWGTLEVPKQSGQGDQVKEAVSAC